MASLRELVPDATWMLGASTHAEVGDGARRLRVTLAPALAAAVTLGGHRRGLAYDPKQHAFVVRGAGLGVTAMKLNEGDTVFAFELARTPAEGALVKTPQGREEIARLSKFGGKRGDKGGVVIKRGGFVEWVRTPQLIVPPIERPPTRSRTGKSSCRERNLDVSQQ